MKVKKILTKISAASLVLSLVFSFVFTVFAETLKETDTKALNTYNKSKDSHRKAVDEYKSARKNYLDAKTKYQQYKRSDDLKITLEQAKNFLNKAGNTMLSYIDTIEKKTQTVTGISDQQRQQILAELQTEKTWITNNLIQLKNVTTKEQLTSNGKEMQLHWVKIKIIAKQISGKMLINKINWTIAKGDKTSTEIQTRINNLKANGKDTASLEALLATFNKNLALAKQKRDDGIAKFNQIGIAGASTMGQLNAELEESNKLLKEGQLFIQQANQYVRDAHKQLKDVVRQIKAQGSSSSGIGVSSISSSEAASSDVSSEAISSASSI